MPIYRNGKYRGPKRLGVLEIPKEGIWLRRVEGKTKAGCRKLFPRSVANQVINSSLGHIEKELKYPIEREVQKIVKTKPAAVIVDWGCGTGRAIKALTEKTKGNARFFGFGDHVFKKWRKPGKAVLVQGTKEDFLRYFKDSSIDFMFSHMGLFHAAGFKKAGNYYLFPENGYLIKLLKKLSVGGVLVTDLSSWVENGLMSSEWASVDKSIIKTTVGKYSISTAANNKGSSTFVFKRII